MIVAGPKLTGGKEVKACSVQKDTFQDYALQEFTTALKEGNGAVCLRNPVIYFTGFRNGDHRRRTPGVMSKAYSGVKDGGEAGRGG